MKFIALFILIILGLFLIWWICAGIFKIVGKVVNQDVKKFKQNWNEEKEKE